jgi:hypothetical protein
MLSIALKYEYIIPIRKFKKVRYMMDQDMVFLIELSIGAFQYRRLQTMV